MRLRWFLLSCSAFLDMFGNMFGSVCKVEICCFELGLERLEDWHPHGLNMS